MSTAKRAEMGAVRPRSCGTTALTLQVLIIVALVMLFVQLARGHDPGTWGTICAIGGGTYIAGIIFFARRT